MPTMSQNSCELCSADFIVRLAEVKRGKGRFCSIVCSNKYKSSLRGSPKKHRKSREFRMSDPFVIAQRSAGHKVFSAIECGKLVRSPCEVCGELKVDAHHDDYKEPLAVRWLCRYHHNKWHRSNGQASY